MSIGRSEHVLIWQPSKVSGIQNTRREIVDSVVVCGGQLMPGLRVISPHQLARTKFHIPSRLPEHDEIPKIVADLVDHGRSSEYSL